MESDAESDTRARKSAVESVNQKLDSEQIPSTEATVMPTPGDELAGKPILGPPAPKETGRIKSLDVARGFALLGIVVVNVDLFALPLGLLEMPGPWEPGVLPTAAAVFVAVFCAGKFYPLFSLLFGIGVSLQRENVVKRGAKYWPLGLRRMAILALFGIFHVLFLWYGDILFVYATAGMVAVLAAGLPSRVKLGIGVAMILVSTLIMVAVTWLTPETSADAFTLREQASLMEVGDKPFSEVIGRITDLEGSIADPLWLAAETKAYKEGSFLQALGFRAVAYASMLVVGVLGFWWSVLGLFLVGGALYEWGIFAPEKERVLMAFLLLAMMVGFPLSALMVLLARSPDTSPWLASLSLAGPMLIGPIVALGYLSAVSLMVRHRFFVGLCTALSAAGRMALTNYLAQSVVLAFVFYHWGLGFFGEVQGHNRFLLALALFVVQVVVSQWWLQRYRFGPLEWLWRTATYGRKQPMKR